MKRYIVLALFVVASMTYVSGQGFGANLFISGHFVTPNDDYLSSLTESIDNDYIERIDKNGLGFGADAYLSIRKFMLGVGFQYFSFSADTSVDSEEVDFGGLGYQAKIGYDFSKSLDLQVVPAVRLGVTSNVLNAPFVTGEETYFGDYLVQEEDLFTSTGFTYGLEVGVIRHFGNRNLNFGVGISAYVDWAVGTPEWDIDGTTVNDVVGETYSIYGVSIKLGGVYSTY